MLRTYSHIFQDKTKVVLYANFSDPSKISFVFEGNLGNNGPEYERWVSEIVTPDVHDYCSDEQKDYLVNKALETVI